jgi:ribosomal protein S18 acetylase RimI-like enzyme
MVFITPASLQDIPTIQETNQQIWPATYAAILSPQQIDFMLEMMYSTAALTEQMNTGHYFIIARNEENNVLGFASYSLIEKEIFKLHKLYVLPARHGDNIGKELLDFVVNDIRFMGAKALDLNVNRYNLRAIAFYHKHHFKVIKEVDINIGNDFYMNDFIMRLYLDE